MSITTKNLRKQYKFLSNEELKEEYYNVTYKIMRCAGIVERMYELGYDIIDIKEQEKHENLLCKKAKILEDICFERGIELWD